MRLYIFIAIIAVSAAVSCTRTTNNGPVSFDETVFDVGTLNEDNKPVTKRFTFTNNTDSALVITRIRSSCGCVSPEYTKTPVEPGKTGTVTIKFDPKRLPGPVSKEVLIYMNGNDSEPASTLYVKGLVERSNDRFASFPYRIGNLRMRRERVDFGTIMRPDKRTEAIHIANDSNRDMSPTFENVPDHMTVHIPMAPIGSEDSGDILVEFRTTDLKPGTYKHTIYVNGTGEKGKKSKRAIEITAEVTD